MHEELFDAILEDFRARKAEREAELAELDELAEQDELADHDEIIEGEEDEEAPEEDDEDEAAEALSRARAAARKAKRAEALEGLRSMGKETPPPEEEAGHHSARDARPSPSAQEYGAYDIDSSTSSGSETESE